jgi:hypothetical protein
MVFHAAVKPFDLLAYQLVVARQELGPLAIAELGCASRRPDEIGEQHRRQHAVGIGGPSTGEELLNRHQHRVGIAKRQRAVGTIELDQRRAGDVLREVAGMIHGHAREVAAMEHERPGADRRKHATKIKLERCLELRCGHARGGARSLLPGIQPSRPRVRRQARADQCHILLGAPPLLYLLHHALENLALDFLRIILPGDPTGRRVGENQRRDAIRIAGSEQHRHRTRVRNRQDRRLLRADGIQHRT